MSATKTETPRTGTSRNGSILNLSHPDQVVPADLATTLPVIPLRRGVLLPGGMFTFSVGRPRSVAALEAAEPDEDGARWVLLAVQREPVAHPAPADLLPAAVLCKVVDGPKASKGPGLHVATGVQRVWLRGFPSTHPYLEASFERIEPAWPDSVEAEASWQAFRDELLGSAETLGGEARVRGLLATTAGDHRYRDRIMDLVAGALDGPQDWTIEVLQTVDPLARSQKVVQGIIRAREIKLAREAIQERLQADAKELQKEHLLRRQMEAIKGELGETGDDELERIKGKLDEAGLPDEVQAVVERELKRLERLSSSSPERSVAIDWLERIGDMPWRVSSTTSGGEEEGASEQIDLAALEAALDHSHHGLSEVKRQVIEHLSVRMLAGEGRADVLLLVGPPGVGKTSIGQAIADAMGKKLVRVALGGVRDEAELRGHRRTYIGSRPGRIVEGIRRAGINDPVMLLDEVDKLVQGWQGNPSAALLEILDPEQNHHFVDHYLEVPWDLSKVLFIATANDLSGITGPLRDRMEVLSIEGYTPEDKRIIARKHLLAKLAENSGVGTDEVEISDAAIDEVIRGWTREAGVRQLQRALGRIFRAAAVKKAKGELSEPLQVDAADVGEYLGKRRFHEDEHEQQIRPGIATGLAWTPVGGDVLYVEASTLPGKGQLILTGQLGDVMKESARAALTYVMSHAAALGIPEDAVRDKDIHLHVPAGAVPKDGPSAGVTMFTALASLLTGRNVKRDLAMTGEATLRGRVLPVGGIKSKVLAAHRLGIRTVILPRRNGHDLDDVPEQVREEMDFVLVDHMSEVFEVALEPEDRSPTARKGGSFDAAPVA